MFTGIITPDSNELPASFGNEALIRQQARLRSREADLMVAAKTAREKAPPQGQMVSGIYVKPSLAQQLTPTAQQIANAVEKKGLEADQTGYDALEASAVRRHMAAMPAQDAPLQSKQQWAMEGSKIPALRPLMVNYANDLMTNEPDRIVNRADKKDAQAQTLAAKKESWQAQIEDRQQARADQAQRQREHDETMRAMKSMGGGGGGGGDKASNYQIVTDQQGNSVRVNKLTGEQFPLGSIGREAAGITKERQEQGEKVSNAKKALSDLDEAERLLPAATGSAAGSLRDTIAGAAGFSTDGAKSAARLDQIASTLAGQVPRLGGATSDKDLAFYKEQVGNLGDRSKPVGTRLAALKQVRKFMERASDPSQYASPTGQPSSAGPSIRQAVEAAADKQSAPKARMKFNPATGQLE
jgi:hypothetical protein